MKIEILMLHRFSLIANRERLQRLLFHLLGQEKPRTHFQHQSLQKNQVVLHKTLMRPLHRENLIELHRPKNYIPQGKTFSPLLRSRLMLRLHMLNLPKFKQRHLECMRLQ